MGLCRARMYRGFVHLPPLHYSSVYLVSCFSNISINCANYKVSRCSLTAWAKMWFHTDLVDGRKNVNSDIFSGTELCFLIKLWQKVTTGYGIGQGFISLMCIRIRGTFKRARSFFLTYFR